jgi:ribosome-binding factor A
MSSHRRRRRFQRPPVDFHGVDEFESETTTSQEPSPAPNRKALQLCRQVEQTLHLALADCADPLLLELLVLRVQPFPDSRRLLVTVQSLSDAAAVLARLQSAGARLRRDVAAGIHRKKTPELVFQVIPT